MDYMQDGSKFLPFVLEKLRGKIEELGVSIEQGQKDIDAMHEYYWENYTEMDEYGYENFDNQQALLQQVNANDDAFELRRRYLRMLSSPFFGRVDYLFDDEDEVEIFYIGIGNFSETEGMVPLIYDWRAPVSSLFYDYDKGPASYTAPGGEMPGEIKAKYQYKIRRGKMIYAFESDVKIDDEVLKQALGEGGADKLKNIVRTIQKEQNAIIRNTKDRILAIQGAAGSGKTSIALHRIAYMLYHDREHLKSSNILILSPSGIFADYISQILPELGEENIREMTFDIYAYRTLREEVSDCEDRYDYLERELSGALTPEDLARGKYKQSEKFAQAMEGYCIGLEDDLMTFSTVTYKGFSYTEKDLLELFYQRFAQIPLLSRMEVIAERFIDEVETLKGKDLPDGDKEKLYERFFGMYETRDIYILYSRFLKEEGLKPLPRRFLEQRILPYEDVYPLLYMKFRLRRMRADSRIRHLVVDEMQDYSWMQFSLLSKMFSCRMTILGDKAQTMGDEVSDVLTFLPSIFGKGVHTMVMNKCYRNTMEIASYAMNITGMQGLEIMDRHGKPVEERFEIPLEAALDEIAEGMASSLEALHPTGEGMETVAVVTLNRDDALYAYKGISDRLAGKGLDTKEAVFHLSRNSKNFRRGLTVTTFYLAKGLEFELVYVLFPRKSKAEEALLSQARYIACTRAMHELVVMDYV